MYLYNIRRVFSDIALRKSLLELLTASQALLPEDYKGSYRALTGFGNILKRVHVEGNFETIRKFEVTTRFRSVEDLKNYIKSGGIATLKNLKDNPSPELASKWLDFHKPDGSNLNVEALLQELHYLLTQLVLTEAVKEESARQSATGRRYKPVLHDLAALFELLYELSDKIGDKNVRRKQKGGSP